MSKKLSIVFYGTPDFAVPSLDMLLDQGYPVAGVVTAPDKPAGRGKKIQESAIKKYAVKKDLNILQPKNLKDEKFLQELKALNADLQVVVAFRMLPEAVWAMPPKGTFNLHASLLPQYRGAAPINRAIMNGETETGVTTFFIEKDIDTGKIIFREKVAIDALMNAGNLHDILMKEGAELVLKTVQAIENDTAPQHDQSLFCKDPSKLKKAPKLTKEGCRIKWHRNVEEVYNHIRGLSPYPGAWTEFVLPQEKKVVKIFAASIDESLHDDPPGTIFTDHKSVFQIAAKNGFINVLELQMEGKKRMSIEEFLRGYSVDKHLKAE